MNKLMLFVVLGLFLALIPLTSAVDTTSCYQESANVSTACGGLSTGSYKQDGAWTTNAGFTWEKTIDGDYGTYSYRSGTGDSEVWMNYTIPKNTINITWQIKGTTGSQNITLPNTCAEQDDNETIYLKVRSRSGGARWSCWTGSVWNDLFEGGTDAVYEEGIIWGILEGDIAITKHTPSDGLNTINSNVAFNTSALTYGFFNFTNVSLHIYNSTDLYDTNFTTITGYSNESYFSMTGFDIGNYNWNVEYCGTNSTSTYCRWGGSNRTFSVQKLSFNTVTYTNGTYETDNSTFSIRLELDSTANIFSSSLIYNGTKYLSTYKNIISNIYEINNTIDIPIINLNTTKNFYWQVNYEDSGTIRTVNSSTYQHEVARANITRGPGTMILNFSIYDEETLEPLNANMDLVLDWWLGGGTVMDNSTFDLNAARSFAFYSHPSEKDFYMRATVNLLNETGENNISYAIRNFDFIKDVYNSTSKEIELFLINRSRGSPVVVEVKDSGLRPVEGVYTTIMRYYTGENKYRAVERRRTDEFGQFVAYLREADTKYKFRFTNENGTILKETQDMTIVCRTSICILSFVVAEQQDDFNRFYDIDGYSNNLSFNNETNRFTFSWIDSTGSNPTHRFLVTRYLFNGTEVVCDITSSSLVGALTCDVGNLIASYQAQSFRETLSGETRVALLSIKVGSPTGNYGVEGLFWSFIFVFTMLAIGIFSPVIAIILYLVSFIGLGLLGVIEFNPAIMIANLVIGVLFIWALKT